MYYENEFLLLWLRPSIAELMGCILCVYILVGLGQESTAIVPLAIKRYKKERKKRKLLTYKMINMLFSIFFFKKRKNWGK